MLALKLVLVPFLIAGVTIAGHRWGPAVAGWLAGLPIVSGPILLFIAIEQGTPFASNAAMGTLSGVLGAVSFCVVYCWAASRFIWPLSLVCGWSAYFGVITLLYLGEPPAYLATVLTVGALILGPRLFPKVTAAAAITVSTYAELSCRMLAGAVLVVLVTHFSSNFGPHLSGLLAVFPVVASVLAVFSHRYSGQACTVVLLRGLVLGLFAFVAFCFVLALWLPALGIVLGFVLALACALLVQYLSRVAIQHAH